jgi:hypothetical protein
MTATRPAGLAETALNEQIEIVGENRISLDSLWRAAGCPGGREPDAWATLAQPLFEGFSGYFASLPRGGAGYTGHRPVLWRWDEARSEPWQAGDLMTNALIARVYAVYLDTDPRRAVSLTTLLGLRGTSF